LLRRREQTANAAVNRRRWDCQNGNGCSLYIKRVKADFVTGFLVDFGFFQDFFSERLQKGFEGA
jgi:hypothetical protein